MELTSSHEQGAVDLVLETVGCRNGVPVAGPLNAAFRGSRPNSSMTALLAEALADLVPWPTSVGICLGVRDPILDQRSDRAPLDEFGWLRVRDRKYRVDFTLDGAVTEEIRGGRIDGTG